MNGTASVKIEDSHIGAGAEVAIGQKVAVHFTGWLEDGQKFDSSVDRGVAFEFVVGQGKVIKGWDMGIAGMRVGGKRRLTVPPEFAYGVSGVEGRIPPNSTLVFDVELLKIEQQQFPFDVFSYRDFPGEFGDLICKYGDSCCFPPFPWGQWVYGQLIQNYCLKLPGDLIELGVGAGGTSLIFASLLKNTDRKIYSLDTYSGLPAPDKALDNPYWRAGLYTGVVPLGPRLRNLAKENQLSDHIEIVEGLFADTLPTLPKDARFSFAHLDSDLYQSVLDSLEGVYDRVVDGGILVIDDFFHHAQGPARAASDFFNARGMTPIYHVVFPYSVGIIKGDNCESLGNRSIDGNVYSFDWLQNDAVLRKAVDQSITQSTGESKAGNNARNLQELLSSDMDKPSNIYAYFLALEDFWDSMAEGF